MWKARWRLTWTHGMWPCAKWCTCTVRSYISDTSACTSQTFLLQTIWLFFLLETWNKCHLNIDRHLNIVSTLTQLCLVSSFPFLFFYCICFFALCVSPMAQLYLPLTFKIFCYPCCHSLLTSNLHSLFSLSLSLQIPPSILNIQHIPTGQRANVGYSVLMAEH